MKAPITKIQILANKDTGHPIFYCHAADRDHTPELLVEHKGANVLLRADQALFKVKSNPQTKNRVDIYMSVDQARHLGSVLGKVVACETPMEWKPSTANPNLSPKGPMKLPKIIWSKVARFITARARARTGLSLSAQGGYINVDLEYPDETHIKMKNYEVHIGIQLDAPTGKHDIGEGVPVHVPESEFQKGRHESNPLTKTRGDFFVQVTAAVGAGLGELLRGIEVPSEDSQIKPIS